MASQRPHICTQWSHFLQQNSLNGLISLASHSLSAWFTEYISPQIYHTIHSMQRICTDSQCAWPCVCVAVFFTTSFLFQSLASFSAYLCVPIQCVVFDWNYIYIWSAAAMPFSKPQLESIQLFCETNATIVYQAKRNVAREQNRRASLWSMQPLIIGLSIAMHHCVVPSNMNFPFFPPQFSMDISCCLLSHPTICSTRICLNKTLWFI